MHGIAVRMGGFVTVESEQGAATNTGYSEERKDDAVPAFPVRPKPFTTSELLSAINAILAEQKIAP